MANPNNVCKLNVAAYRCNKTGDKYPDKCKLNKNTNRCVLKNKPPGFNYKKNKKYIDSVLKFPLSITNVEIPNLKKLLNLIKRIVEDNWNNSKLEIRNTYNSKGFKDLYTKKSLANDTNVLIIKDLDEVDENHYSGRLRENIDSNHKRQLNSIASDFNNKYFLKKGTRLKFLFIVISAYNAMIESIYSKDSTINKHNLNIIFKGGNVYRIIIKEVIRDFTQKNENYLLEKFKNYIKEGDFDFEFISYKLPNKKIAKINTIIQLVILAIRNWVLKNNIFDFLNEAIKSKRTKLKKMLNLFDTLIKSIKTGYLKDVKVDYVQAGKILNKSVNKSILQKYIKFKFTKNLFNKRTDFTIIQNGSSTGKEVTTAGVIKTNKLLEKYNISKKYQKLSLQSRQKGSEMYCTYNGSVRFKLIDNKLISFSLSRIKYNYILYFRKPNKKGGFQFLKMDVPGEILDVSHEFNEDFKKFTNSFDKEKKIAFQNVRNTNLSLYMLSTNGAMHDHEQIILNQAGNAPWTLSNKYKKRLYRIIIMYIISLLSKDKHNIKSKIEWLKTLINEIQSEKFKKTPSKDINRMKTAFKLIQKQKNVGTGYSEYKKTLITIIKDILAVIISQYSSTRNQVFGNYNIIDI